MRTQLLAQAIAILGLAVSSTTVDAQYRPIPINPPGTYRVARPVFPSYVPTFPQPPVLVPGVNYDRNALGVVRSLYYQHLKREPDPQGLQTWIRRYHELGGDVRQLNFEFAQSAFIEQNANNPAYRLRPFP